MTSSWEQPLERSEAPDSPDRVDIESRLRAAENLRPEQAGTQRPSLPEVSGFDRSKVLTDAEVKNHLGQEFPAEHVSSDSLTDVQYTDQYRPVPGGYELGRCTEYQDGTRRIEVHRQPPEADYSPEARKDVIGPDAMKGTITHEVGHNVYWDLPPQTQQAWESLSAQSGPDDYVSEYARTDVQEDFSESYRTYIHDPELLQDVNPDKYTFLRNQVFEGREYL